MAVIHIDVSGETCPVPLVETRKALRKARAGDLIVVTGTHPPSRVEIPMALKPAGIRILGLEEDDGRWKITIRK